MRLAAWMAATGAVLVLALHARPLWWMAVALAAWSAGAWLVAGNLRRRLAPLVIATGALAVAATAPVAARLL